MSDLERYLDRVIDQTPANTAMDTVVERVEPVEVMPHGWVDESEEEASVNLLQIMLKRWYIVLASFVVISAIGVPGVWYLVEPGYIVSGLIHIAPAQENLLSGDAEQGFQGEYELFKTTQAMRVTSSAVLENVASELAERNMTLFQEQSGNSVAKLRHLLGLQRPEADPLEYLRDFVRFGVLRADPIRHSQFVKVSMKSMKDGEAKIIVDSLMQNYEVSFTSQFKAGELDNLQALEEERDALVIKMKNTNDEIRALADKYGTTSLNVTQELMLQRATTLLAQLANLEASRIDLESSLDFIEEDDPEAQSLQATATLAARNEYIAADPLVQELTSAIVDLEQELVVAEQALAPGNPALKEKRELLATFKQKLEAARSKVGADFDQIVVERKGETREDKIAATRRAIERIKAHEEKLKQILSQQEIRTQEMGRTHMDISDLEFQQSLNRELHESVSRRIRAKEMEKKRDPVVKIDTWAEIEAYEDNRVKFSAGIVFGALGLGAVLAFLREKMDKRLKQPEEITKCIQVPLVGTVVSSNAVKPSVVAEQIAGDYQAIRTNLELFGDGIPKKLAVTSACSKEGKTVFSINLATSMAKSGRRVLLIDGDLRTPGVLRLFDESNISQRPCEAVDDGYFAYTQSSVLSSGLDILAPNPLHTDAYELLASPLVTQRIGILGQRYEHIIIDTPPVLAFPDALIWARIAGHVVLSCYAGRTTSHDLNEAKLRIVQTHAVILGAVMNNVRLDHRYQRHGPGYQGRRPRPVKRGQIHKERALLSVKS